MQHMEWTGAGGMWFGGHWLMLLLWAAIIVPPFWKIFAKAGFSGWLSLVMLVPLANLIVLYVVAFSSWPALRREGIATNSDANPD